MPREPATPPGLLTTLMFTPRMAAISAETTRLQTSVPPPAPQTTMLVMSLLGYFLAMAMGAATSRTRQINTSFFMHSSRTD